MIKFIRQFLNKKNDRKAIFYALDGEVERKLGNLKKARKSISVAIEKEPDNDMFYITRALIYKEMKKYKDALFDIDKAIELNGSVQKAQQIKEELIQLMK